MPSRDLTFSVAHTVPHRVFQVLDAVLVRRKRAHEHRGARTDLHCAPVKERSAQRPRTPSIVATRPCGRADCQHRRLIAFADNPSTRFTVRGGLAMSRTESQRTASTGEVLRPKAKGSPMRDALSRSLQPTSIHEHPQTSRLPSLALARFRPMRRPPALFRVRLHALVPEKLGIDARSPLPAAWPQVMTRLGVAFTCCETLRPPP